MMRHLGESSFDAIGDIIKAKSCNGSLSQDDPLCLPADPHLKPTWPHCSARKRRYSSDVLPLNTASVHEVAVTDQADSINVRCATLDAAPSPWSAAEPVVADGLCRSLPMAAADRCRWPLPIVADGRCRWKLISDDMSAWEYRAGHEARDLLSPVLGT